MFKNLNDKITEKIGEIGDSIKDAVKAQNTPLDLSIQQPHCRKNRVVSPQTWRNKHKLMEDAQKLADYLGVPIWEGSHY